MNKDRKYTTPQVVGLFVGALALVTTIFMAQSYLFIGELDWIRTPKKLFDETRQHHHLVWHIIGATGGVLFSSRFWLQWWYAEKHQRSEFNKVFWWASIIGSVITLAYFVHISDNVGILRCTFGLIPYIRNLMLIRQEKAVDNIS